MKLKNLWFLMALIFGIGLCGTAAAQVKPTINVIDTLAVNQNGVAGANNLTEGDFTLEITLKQ